MVRRRVRMRRAQAAEDALLLADPDLKVSLDQMRRGQTVQARTAAEETSLALGRLTEHDMAVMRRQVEELNAEMEMDTKMRETGHRCAVMIQLPGGEFLSCLNEATRSYLIQACSCTPKERDRECTGPAEIHECDGPHSYGA